MALGVPWWAWLIGLDMLAGTTRTGPDARIEPAILPQAGKLKRRPQTRAIIYHTTGSGLAKVAARGGPAGSYEYELAALAWYRSSGQPFYGHYLVGPSGRIHQLADQGAWCQHSASLTDEQAAGRVRAPGWWYERWPGVSGPAALIGQHFNYQTLAIDCLPALGNGFKGFTEVQLDACAWLGRYLAGQYEFPSIIGSRAGILRHIHLGHEDIDPWRRGITSSGQERPWDPGWDWPDFMRRL